MERLHWLPVWEIIDYIILLLTYKSSIDLAPNYLSGRLQVRPDWGSRKDNLQVLIEPKINEVTYCDRSFRKSALDY